MDAMSPRVTRGIRRKHDAGRRPAETMRPAHASLWLRGAAR